MQGLPSTTAAVSKFSTRAAGATFIGTLLEFYDFTLYTTAAATVFPVVFFAGSSPFMATLQSVATFSVAYLLRPFSGAMLGVLGDRIGRRRVLMWSLMTMGLSTVGIGLIPTRAAIGWAAPVLLLVLRILQGIGESAEFSGATVVAVEFAPQHRQGLLGSLPAAANGLGGILASLALLAVETAVPKAQFLAWGWRIPFLLSAVLVVYGIWVRVRLPETPAFQPLKESGALSRHPFRDTFRSQGRALVSLMLMSLARTGLAYFILVFLVTYAAHQAGMSSHVTLIGLLIGYVVYAVLTPTFGWLCDIVGRRPVAAFGLLVALALAFPLFVLVRPGWPVGLWIAMFIGNGVAVAACVAPYGRLLAEHFPAQHRYTGMGIASETGIAIGGAAIPPLAVYLSHLAGANTTPLSLLLIAVAAAGLVGLLILPRLAARVPLDAVTEHTVAPQVATSD